MSIYYISLPKYKALRFLPLLQFLAFFLRGWEYHSKVWSINFKKDAVLRAGDIGERGRLHQFLILVVGEAFLRTKNKKGNLTAKGSQPGNTSSPQGVCGPANKLYHTMDLTGGFDTHSNTPSPKCNL